MCRLITGLLLMASPLVSFGQDGGYGDEMLVRGATVIVPEDGSVVADQCIRISEDRITEISQCRPGDTAKRIVDANNRCVIPGLWDMHVHSVWDVSAYRDFFSDFVAWGVVGIRDMGGSAEALAEAREFLSDRDNIGPELIAAGPLIDGMQPLHPSIAIAAANYEDGVRSVEDLSSMGADFIKIYTTLPAEAARGVFDEAHRRGLKVAGHLPAELELTDALRSGMLSIEHMAVEIGGLCDVNDGYACRQVFGEIKAAGVYLTPTLVVRQRPGTMSDPQTIKHSRISEMPPLLAAEWQASLDKNLQQRDDSWFLAKRDQYAREQKLTEIAIQAESRILVGTDAGDFLIPPGSSIHEELELLVAAGMEAREALLAATGRAADFLGRTDRGRIREGAVADLVILNGNPLEDIRNTRNIAAVILRGRLLDADRLECMRAGRACDRAAIDEPHR